MERPPSAARRRTLDLPAKPEAGLAEWTTKIKALQRQVDEDEEAETKRLEQEIAASRLARMRRSTGYTQVRNLDLSDSENALKDDDPQTFANTAISTPDKLDKQGDALRKLMGDTRETKDRPTMASPSRSTPSAAPISLAAFMGGRATGPRLTRHAPQQDAHDPTQFEQRTHVTAPHPVFGRGGVAMPGMTGKPHIPSNATGTHGERDKLATVSNQPVERARKISTPSIPKTFVENVRVQESPVVPQKTGSWQTTRQRTISTPSGFLLSKAEPPPSPSFSPSPRATTPQAQHKSSPPPASNSPIPRSSPSFQTFSPSSSSPASRSVPSFQTSPSMAHLSPRVSCSTYRSAHQSPAFLRTPPSKEPTPSISRLQGRGFVQSMVKASSQLEMGVMGSPTLPERTDSPGKKQTPVLDRWQFIPGSPAASPSPPIISPKPVPLRKTRTVDPDPTPASPTPSSVKPEHTGRPKSRASLPAMSDVHSSSGASDSGRDSAARAPGLGSSSTMISYIKPLKTGDRPPTASPPPRAEVDELGVRVQAKGGGVPVGKPLSHLTKDRAKKPRRTKAAQEPARRGSPPLSVNSGLIQPASQPKMTSPAVTVAKPHVAELLVSATPVSSHVSKPPPSPRIVSPLTNRFDDNFTPPAKPVVPRKPPPSVDSPIITRRISGVCSGADKSPVTPGHLSRHTRIPSTGNRATVMDVAQAFHARGAIEPPNSTTSTGAVVTPVDEVSLTKSESEEDALPLPDVKSLVANWGPGNGAVHLPSADKRKSSFEKYSAIALPPLQEEKTPVSSPAGTLARSTVAPVQEPAVPEASDGNTGLVDMLTRTKAKEPVRVKESKYVRIGMAVPSWSTDRPLPTVDIDALLNAHETGTSPHADTQTISIDVMSIIGNTATAVKGDTHVFYDNEVLAIIYRAKAVSSGLVSTQVWGWRGKRCTLGEREERKLQDLARRYNTTLVTVNQYCESPDFVAMLGGLFVTRQGTRTHWSSENTAMHLVRCVDSVIFIDELELLLFIALDTLYVWHGCGSTEKERSAAMQYAQGLAAHSSSVVEMLEGVTDNDEMFWMILGDGGYAKADYWKWRPPAANMAPRFWQIDAHQRGNEVFAVPSLSDRHAIHDFVYIADCVWEFFVIVCSEARGKRQDIRLALSTALELSRSTASSRPFTPTVHVLILPSQIPTDLRLHFRDLDEVQLNCGIIPDHMNLVSVSEAEEHLRTTVWEKAAVQDPVMLPLGVHTSNMQ
ncbi:hypothetical protein B0H21DRAFT_860691 [Amylocystis lapponica]|nr:hypothetical protein B0H21DRAFT_860691 [Amylocystis lapponica]